MTMSATPKFLSGFCDTSLNASSANDALGKIATSGYELDLMQPSWLNAVLERENEFPTGLPTPIPVAIPHTDSIHVKASGIGFFRLLHPVIFGEMGSSASTLEVSIIIPLLITDPENQVDLLMQVVTALQDIAFMNQLANIDNPKDVEILFNSRFQPSD